MIIFGGGTGMNHNVTFNGIDRSPWLSIKSMKVYLDYRSGTSVRNFIEENQTILKIKRIKGGQIRVKQSSIDEALVDV